MAAHNEPLPPSSRPSDSRAPDAPGPATRVSECLGALPATIWMTDTRLTLTFIDGALLRQLQIPAERVLGRTLPDLLLDGREDHPLIHGHLTALAGHETTVRIEWGGDVFGARMGPVRDATNAIIGVAGVHQQIAWTPDEEGTLRESDIRLGRAVDANIVGIVFGNEDGQITEANEAFFELAGYTREDLTADGISWPVLVPVEFHQRQMNAIEEVRLTGRCRPFESELIRKDGRRVQVLVGGARISARRREGVAFVLDISGAARVTRHLRAELAAADALLDATPSQAGEQVLPLLCSHLAWDGAMLWQASPGQPGHIATRYGACGATDAALNELARRAAAAGDVTWSAPARTMAMPLSAADGHALVLLLVSGVGHTPDAETIAVTRSIGHRLARVTVPGTGR